MQAFHKIPRTVFVFDALLLGLINGLLLEGMGQNEYKRRIGFNNLLVSEDLIQI